MHVIAADWWRHELHLLATGPDGLRDVRWDGAIDWTVSESRHCVGRMTRDGHVPCPFASEVTHDRICGRCAPPWSDCVFEPIDHGHEHCGLCHREHVVYLAFYGALPKVGMTSAGRVETRLQEQGADAYFIVQRRRDRHAARRTEQSVALLHGIPERRRHREIFRGLDRPIDRDLIDRRAADWSRRLAERFDVEAVQHLDHPLAVLPKPPARVEAPGHHEGKVLGAKGRYLFYQTPRPLGDAVAALPLGDLVGRRLQC